MFTLFECVVVFLFGVLIGAGIVAKVSLMAIKKFRKTLKNL